MLTLVQPKITVTEAANDLTFLNYAKKLILGHISSFTEWAGLINAAKASLVTYVNIVHKLLSNQIYAFQLIFILTFLK